MSDTEQQLMETSENGHEGEEAEDFNGAGPTEEETEEAVNEGEEEALPEACADEGVEDDRVEEEAEAEAEAEAETTETLEGEESQNGASEGGQINASKGEEDAG